MPSLLAPNPAASASRSYTPLADEVNPPFGTHTPTVTRNGTVVYGKRGSVSERADDADGGYSGVGAVPLYRAGSDDTLSTMTGQVGGANGNGKGKARAVQGVEDDEGDIGELRRGGTVRAGSYHAGGREQGEGYGNPGGLKGKGKERAWDEEMGGVEVVESYPPGNEEADAERKVQERLAKLTARTMAQRQAARLSRTIPAHPPTSPAAAGTSFMRRPLSMLGSMSFMGGGNVQAQALPLASPTRPTITNPYDPPPRGLSPTPRMVSPTSPVHPSPFADPPTSPGEMGVRRASLASTSTSPPIQSPTDAEFTYGYAGAQWRGGAGAGAVPGQQLAEPKPPRGEKWWHAICSWGDDLDGGHDDQNEGRNQAGRTNPFE